MQDEPIAERLQEAETRLEYHSNCLSALQGVGQDIQKRIQEAESQVWRWKEVRYDLYRAFYENMQNERLGQKETPDAK